MLRFATLAAALIAGAAPLSAAEAQDPPPLELFATYEAVDNVALSPDGRYLALMRLPARNANYIIEVFDTTDLSQQPTRFGADRMEIQSYSWVGPEHIWVSFRQQVRDMVRDTNQGVFESKRAIIKVTGDDPWDTLPDDAQLISSLVEEPEHILIRTANLDNNLDIEGRAISGVVNPNYYRYNLRTGRQRQVLRGTDRFDNIIFDWEGDPTLAVGFDVGAAEQIYYFRPDGSDSWNEFLRAPIDEPEVYGDAGITPLGRRLDAPNELFVRTPGGTDKYGVELIDMNTGATIDVIYRRDDVDVLGSVSTPWVDEPSEIAGFVHYAGGERNIAWIDEEMAAIQSSVDAAFPTTRNFILDCVNRCAQMLVATQGPKDPGSYYYIADGQARYIGGEYPLIEPQQLGEMDFVTWTARDGREISGYVTYPAFGEPPYPLVVLPHGGPWVSENPSYDEWPALLGAYGYMVLQPQYRGSLGYGIDFWFDSWGEWGLAMQDDKDDGALYLAEQGLVDPDRMAMFGWSYGGYAAFVAASREEQIYQCAIAGAGVSDIGQQGASFTNNRFLRRSILEGYEGVDPIDRAAQTNIPLLIIHGELDQRVRIQQSDQYVRAVRNSPVQTRYVVLEDADHFSNTINYENQLILYTELLSWLAGPCGMPTAGNPEPRVELGTGRTTDE
jgi:dienelactone hydrolase